MAARVLVAPDSFKGTFSAQEVAAACAAGLEAAGCEPELCPIADGGEGTMLVLVGALGGELVPVDATDPVGRPIRPALGLTDGGARAIVEVAEASGLSLLAESERDPELTSTAGTGQLIVAARDRGAERILVAAGGSATVDGGAGAIEAIEAAGGLGDSRLTVLCDVETEYDKAAAVFGPQKGATPEAVANLVERLDRFASELPRDPRGRPRTGAAGGLSGGLWAAFSADLAGGAEFVLDALGFDSRIERSDVVISGEGALDSQSFSGKAVGHVAERCAPRGVPVHALVGSNQLQPEEATQLGLASVRVASTRREIVAAAEELGGELSPG